MKSYGRRSSDGMAQALLWVQVVALAILWAVNMAHLSRLGKAIAEAKATADSAQAQSGAAVESMQLEMGAAIRDMRRETEAVKAQRKAFYRAALDLLRGLGATEKEDREVAPL